MGLSNLHLRRLQSNQGLDVEKTAHKVSFKAKWYEIPLFIQCFVNLHVDDSCSDRDRAFLMSALASSLPSLVIACNLLRKSISRSFKRRLYSLFTLYKLSYTICTATCYRIMRYSAECKVISPSHARIDWS